MAGDRHTLQEQARAGQAAQPPSLPDLEEVLEALEEGQRLQQLAPVRGARAQARQDLAAHLVACTETTASSRGCEKITKLVSCFCLAAGSPSWHESASFPSRPVVHCCLPLLPAPQAWEHAYPSRQASKRQAASRPAAPPGPWACRRCRRPWPAPRLTPPELLCHHRQRALRDIVRGVHAGVGRGDDGHEVRAVPRVLPGVPHLRGTGQGSTRQAGRPANEGVCTHARSGRGAPSRRHGAPPPAPPPQVARLPAQQRARRAASGPARQQPAGRTGIARLASRSMGRSMMGVGHPHCEYTCKDSDGASTETALSKKSASPTHTLPGRGCRYRPEQPSRPKGGSCQHSAGAAGGLGAAATLVP